MLSLITAALEGLAAIPKILDYIKQLQIDAKLAEIDRRQQALNDAYKGVSNAKTSQEIDAAAAALSAAWNGKLPGH